MTKEGEGPGFLEATLDEKLEGVICSQCYFYKGEGCEKKREGCKRLDKMRDDIKAVFKGKE